MIYLILLLLLIIFSNQYLLFNEELFIILAFFCLCFFVKNNLGGLVQNELSDRKNKILNSYIDFLKKKSINFNLNSKNIKSKIDYLYNYSNIQKNYYNKFVEMFDLSKNQVLSEESKNLEAKFILYFASLVSNKRKFL